MMDLDLTGKRALVCGASRGIGRAVAQTLAALGAKVTVLARSEKDLSQTVASLDTGAGQEHGLLVTDSLSVDSLTATIKALILETAPVQILVNNSGGPPPGPAHTADAEEFTRAFTQHVIANHKLLEALLPGMKESGYGRIINIISTSVKEPIKGLGVSNTIRGAVASWAKTLAGELGPSGITVNNVLPGFTSTERLASLLEGRAKKTGRPLADIEQDALNSVPMGRFARPAEIADAVAFLASPAAAYINGINLPVDGGRTSSL